MTFREFKLKFQKKEVEEVFFDPPENPKVSVLVQTFQQKNYIKQCLESVLTQKTNFQFEILIGDDGSTDGTREICMDYVRQNPKKIRLFLNCRENQITTAGEPSSTFNSFYNFFSARGEYIAFCEGDDMWTDPFKLQKQVNFLEKTSGFSFTYHSYITIDERGEKNFLPLETNQPKHDLTKEDLLNGNYHPLLLTICFKKGGIDIPTEIFEVLNVDTFLLNLFGKSGAGKYQSNISPSLYRISAGGIWSKKIRVKKLMCKIHTYQKLAEFYKRTNQIKYSKIYNQKIKVHYKMLVLSHIRNKNFILAGKASLKYVAIILDNKIKGHS